MLPRAGNGAAGLLINLIQLIMCCITTPSLGSRASTSWTRFSPRIPAFPALYLFIMCVEAFSVLLQKDEEEKSLYSIRFNRKITASHLLFANDSLIFVRATVHNCVHLKNLFTGMPQPPNYFSTMKSLLCYSAQTLSNKLRTKFVTFSIRGQSPSKKSI